MSICVAFKLLYGELTSADGGGFMKSKSVKIQLILILASLSFGGVTLASTALSDPPPNFGPIQNILYEECLLCHDHSGNSTSPIFPRLAGQIQSYLVKELKAFRDHTRRDPDAFGYMYGPASALNDNKIQLLAEYFSVQTPTPNSPGDPSRAKLGEVIFKNGIPANGVPPCYSCHGDSAQGNNFAPRLAGQSAGYIVRQLEAFKRDERHEATTMPIFAKYLTLDQEKDVANYLQGLN